MITIEGAHPEAWGFIPGFLDEHDPRPAKEQFHANYVSGWGPIKGFRFEPTTYTVTYPEDPPMTPIGRMNFRDEVILLYPSSWVLILQPDGAWEMSRMD